MIELRWIDVFVIEDFFSRTYRVLQFRRAVNPQSEIELHGPIWSAWQDVPVVKE